MSETASAPDEPPPASMAASNRRRRRAPRGNTGQAHHHQIEVASKEHGLAVFALVLSCLAFLLGPLTAIPGLICGHIAAAACRRDPDLRGRGMATAALIIGYVVIGAVVLFVIGLVAVSASR